MCLFTISEVRVGHPVPFGPRGEPSAIDKRPVTDPVLATPLGMTGDAQGDPRRHGGLDKAVHAYPASHYPQWRQDLPGEADRFPTGAFGENLVVEGATEGSICLGDIIRAGGAVVEVSQARQPCWKLNVRFGRTDMARRVQTTGRTGWYFRVLTPGLVAAGDAAILEARPNPDWPLTRAAGLLYRDRLNRADLEAFVALPSLTEGWRRLAEVRLASNRTEDWSARLDTPE